ncbi:MAG: T9SS type A sorting domain-containing protein [Ignavibacteria bacterium]|nr:T9SS type A sorting domain-containing protein [Ignavibacteria bacterium]
MSQNFPNPFNPATSIKFNLPVKSHVTLKVYNGLGKEIIELVNEQKPEGSYEVKFDASNLPSGVYYYKMVSDNFSETKKMILIK